MAARRCMSLHVAIVHVAACRCMSLLYTSLHVAACRYRTRLLIHPSSAATVPAGSTAPNACSAVDGLRPWPLHNAGGLGRVQSLRRQVPLRPDSGLCLSSWKGVLTVPWSLGGHSMTCTSSSPGLHPVLHPKNSRSRDHLLPHPSLPFVRSRGCPLIIVILHAGYLTSPLFIP